MMARLGLDVVYWESATVWGGATAHSIEDMQCFLVVSGWLLEHCRIQIAE